MSFIKKDNPKISFYNCTTSYTVKDWKIADRWDSSSYYNTAYNNQWATTVNHTEFLMTVDDGRHKVAFPVNELATSQHMGYNNVDKIQISVKAAANSIGQMVQSFQNVQNSMQAMTAPLGAPKPPSGFNKYVNASDLLEEFIKFLGDEGVRRAEIMGMPVELFIKWLIIRACEEDEEEPNVTLELPAPAKQPRCLGCQRFMKRGTVVPLHGETCSGLYFRRQELIAA